MRDLVVEHVCRPFPSRRELDDFDHMKGSFLPIGFLKKEDNYWLAKDLPIHAWRLT